MRESRATAIRTELTLIDLIKLRLKLWNIFDPSLLGVFPLFALIELIDWLFATCELAVFVRAQTVLWPRIGLTTNSSFFAYSCSLDSLSRVLLFVLDTIESVDRMRFFVFCADREFQLALQSEHRS